VCHWPSSISVRKTSFVSASGSQCASDCHLQHGVWRVFQRRSVKISRWKIIEKASARSSSIECHRQTLDEQRTRSTHFEAFFESSKRANLVMVLNHIVTLTSKNLIAREWTVLYGSFKRASRIEFLTSEFINFNLSFARGGKQHGPIYYTRFLLFDNWVIQQWLDAFSCWNFLEFIVDELKDL